MCNNKGVMSNKWNSEWRPPPSWIYYFCPFWSNCVFPVAAVYISAKFHLFTSICGWVIAVCTKIQDGGGRHLFLFNILAWLCRTSSVIHMPIFLQICAIRNAAILILLFFFILLKRSISGGSRLHCCKISFIYVNLRPSYCCLCKNPRRLKGFQLQ